MLTKDDLIGIMIFLGQDFGPKFAFSRFASPLIALYSARDKVVLSIELARKLLDGIALFDLGLEI